jgi:hypothetical protein
MTHRHEDTIRRSLQDLREGDELDAPAFDAVQARPARTYRFDSRRVTSVALAASVLLVAGAVVVRQAMRPSRLVVPEYVIELSSWRPASDALLESPSLGWYAAPPLSDQIFPVVSPDLPREPMP